MNNQQQSPIKSPTKQPDGKTIIIGIVVVLVVLFIASRLFGGSGDPETTPTAPSNDEQPVQNNSDEDLNLGTVVVAENVDRDGCAVDVTNTFDDNDTIYAVLEDTAAPEGTTIFARLYHGDTAVEDSDEITADQDYNNVCVNFAFDNSEDWDSGDYEIEFYVNGNAYQSAGFAVR